MRTQRLIIVITAVLLTVLLAPNLSPGKAHVQAAPDNAAIQVSVDGALINLQPAPIQQGGRVLVPLRGVFEAMDATVDWNGAAKQVQVTKGERRIVLTLGSRMAVIDGKAEQLDEVPAMLQNSVMVPLRFVSEALDGVVQWDPAGKVSITTAKNAAGGDTLGPPAPPQGGGEQPKPPTAYNPLEGDGMHALTKEEQELAQLINGYRKELGLPEFTLSKSLTKVARYHVYDSIVHAPAVGECNMHSWSNQGPWSGGCYTKDHSNASLMWEKPSEISGGVYTGNGYEISYRHSHQATPAGALAGWKGSPGHNNVIIGNGSWSTLKTMGVAIHGGYAHVWFGDESDPAGYF